MEENSTPPTTIPRSEYTQRVEAVAKELIALVESRKDESETGLILISVNTEKGADKDEVIISMVGTGRTLKTGLRLFADQDPKMGALFDKVAADRALLKLLTKLT
jgi:hypothetical protein